MRVDQLFMLLLILQSVQMLVGSLSTAVVVDQNQDEVCCCAFGYLQLQFCCEIFSVAPLQCSDTVFRLFLCQGLYAIL